MTKIKETTDYIAEAASFAQPLLEYWRRVIHEECPEVQEVIKWNFPCYEYKGFLFGTTAHKKHCSFVFWKGEMLADRLKIIHAVGKSGMGSLGKTISQEDLPSDEVFREYVREAIQLNEQGVKKKARRQPVEVPPLPADFAEALGSNIAQDNFANFSPSNKRDYIEWITEAKTEATRMRRIAQAVEWIEEGKVRNWKYLKKNK